MKRVLTLVATLAMTLGLMAPSATAANDKTNYDVRLVGAAKAITADASFLSVRAQVLCPAGETVNLSYAGVEGYLGPGLPSHHPPQVVECAGRWVNASTSAMSTGKNAPPPRPSFEHGRAAMTVRIGANEFGANPVYAQTTQTVMINTRAY